MNRLWIVAVTAAFVSAGMAGIGSAAEPVQPAQARVLADTVKPGQWEFTSQMQMPGGTQLPPGVQLPAGSSMQPGAGMRSTYRACIDSEKAVPSDPRGTCKIDNVRRTGATVTWTGTCTTGQGPVRSEGVAHYSGDRMEANLTTHVPGAGGQGMKTTQHITGHYLGACAR
jgi:Protein of unknown function (DUF3617)